MVELFLGIVIGLLLIYLVASTVAIAAIRFLFPPGATRKFFTVVSILAAIFSPFVYFGAQEREERAKDLATKELVAKSCLSNEMKIDSVLKARDAFVDRRFLKMVIEPRQDILYFDQVIQYFLKSKLNSLETQNSVLGGIALVDGDKDKSSFIRLSIAEESDPRCKTFNKLVNWESYPSQYYPRARELGLVKGSCMALEFEDQISSKIQITLYQEDIKLSGSSDKFTRYDIDLLDVSTVPATKYASLVEHYSGGGGGNAGYHYGFPCGDKDNRRVVEFNEALVGQGNARVRVPTVAHVPVPVDAVSYASVSKSFLSKFRWDSAPEQNWVTGVISSDRSVWISSRYVTKGAGQPGATISLEGYELNILGDGVIYRTPIAIAGVNSVDITGLAKMSNGYALIAFLPGHRHTAKRYLLEFDKQGRNFAATELSVDEYELVKVAAKR